MERRTNLFASNRASRTQSQSPEERKKSRGREPIQRRFRKQRASSGTLLERALSLSPRAKPRKSRPEPPTTPHRGHARESSAPVEYRRDSGAEAPLDTKDCVPKVTLKLPAVHGLNIHGAEAVKSAVKKNSRSRRERARTPGRSSIALSKPRKKTKSSPASTRQPLSVAQAEQPPRQRAILTRTSHATFDRLPRRAPKRRDGSDHEMTEALEEVLALVRASSKERETTADESLQSST